MKNNSSVIIIVSFYYLIGLALLISLPGCSSYEVKGVDYTNQDDNRNIPRREFTK